jgi:hypothetical protein
MRAPGNVNQKGDQGGVWEVTPDGREFAQAELEAACEASERDEDYPEGRDLLRLHR